MRGTAQSRARPMSRKGARTSLERGISKDASGYSVRVSVGSGRQQRLREQRFPSTVDLPYLRAQRASMEAELRAQIARENPARAHAVRGTLAGDVEQYLVKVKPQLAPETYRSRLSELKAWTDVLGDRPRHTLRDTDIRRAFARWQEPQDRAPIVKDGKTYKPRPWVAPSPKTIQNRCRSLTHLYHTLDGEKARTPLDDVDLPAVPQRLPRPTSLPTIHTVIANLIAQEQCGRLRDAATRARFLIMVTTGQRPIQIARTTPDDLDLDANIWYVPDAKDGAPIALPLNRDMRAAWDLFVSVGDAWGTWDSSSAARVLRRAGWPATVRPYNARHTVGIALSEAGISLGDIQPFMNHKRIETTRTFYVPGQYAQLKAASDALDGRINLAPTWARYMGTTPKQRKTGAKQA